MTKFIQYFYTDWCIYCKKFNPVWDEIKQLVQILNKMDEQIVCEEYNMDEDNGYINKENIVGYPTIKLINTNTLKNIDYVGERTSDDILLALMNL